ncbi:MAG: cytochrome-c peroxidase [Hymenobacteraceae bacterium]|nr:cytochrome-c peroxidase [Hymenobacteraceae bacterium]
MWHRFRGLPLTHAAFVLVASLLTTAACNSDPGPTDFGSPPVPAPTPYQLVVPATLFAPARIPASNPLTNEGVELGRFLFYEKRLSADNTVSCGTCHQQAKAFTDGRAVSQGVNGGVGRRSAMSLANVMWVDSLNWDFRFTSIEAQNRFPLTHPNEMGQPLAVSVSKLQNTPDYPLRFERAFGTRTITEDLLLKALGQFQRTLISGRARFDLARTPSSGVRLTPDEEEGFLLFSTHPSPTVRLRGGNCGDCHGSGGLFRQQLMTSANNGLDALPLDSGIASVTRRTHDFGKFGVPSLRNAALTAPYMHDGRFRTLEDVLDHYNEHVALTSPNLTRDMRASNLDGGRTLLLTPEEKRKIILFLHTLTDTAFVADRRFSDPFHP